MTSEEPAALLEGVYVANVTPFLDDDRYSIDHRSYGAHVRWLADHGVTGIVPFGTNGEGPATCRSSRQLPRPTCPTPSISSPSSTTSPSAR